MSKYQALIDALAGVNGQLGQPSLHSGHVIYAETEEWCSADINVKLAANKHISGPLARFIKEAANPATIRALLADLEMAEKALAALAKQAQEPCTECRGPLGSHDRTCSLGNQAHPVRVLERSQKHMVSGISDDQRATINSAYTTPPAPQVPPNCLTCNGHGLIGGHMPDGSGHGEPCPDCNAPQVPAPVDEREALKKLESAAYGALSHVASANYPNRVKEAGSWIRDAFEEARAALQYPAPQTKGGEA